MRTPLKKDEVMQDTARLKRGDKFGFVPEAEVSTAALDEQRDYLNAH